MQISQRSTSQKSCSIVFSQMPPNMCHLPVRCCTDPSGAAYSNVQVFIRKGTTSRISSLHSNMSACGTWWRWRLIATMLMLCTRKVEDLCNWIYVLLLMLLQWLLILYSGSIYWSREWHRYTEVLSLDKAGHYRMVSEHSIAYRIETLGLD
jgi:hypothetical protein